MADIDNHFLQRIDDFLQEHCTEQDDHDDPHSACSKCAVMRTQLIALLVDYETEVH